MIKRLETVASNAVQRTVARAGQTAAPDEPQDSLSPFPVLGAMFEMIGLITGVDGVHKLGQRVSEGPRLRRPLKLDGLDNLTGPGKHLQRDHAGIVTAR